MCGPAAVPIVTALAGTAINSFAQNKAQDRQFDEQERIRLEQMRIASDRQAQQLAADTNRNKILLGSLSNESDSNRQLQESLVQAEREKNQAQLDALGINSELTGDKLNQRVAENAGGREATLNRDIDNSVASGLLDAGSGVQGNVSQSFTSAGEAAQKQSVNRAQGLAKYTAFLGGFRDSQFDESNLVRDQNVQSGLAINAALSKARGAQQLRQAQQGFSIADQLRANIAGTLPPEKTTILDFNPNSRSAQNLAALGNGLRGFAPFARFPGSQPQLPIGDNPSIHAPPLRF